MAVQYPAIDERLMAFIARQKLFFVATAAPGAHINLSPKGLDTLRVLGPNRVVWLNLTGSGNETAAHLREDGRITLMFCAFAGEPLILRLYGTARAVHEGDEAWPELVGRFPPLPGARQVIDVSVERVQTSCGFGVPLFDFVGERDLLVTWAEKKGVDGLRRYRAEKNAVSIDGRETGLPERGLTGE